MGGAEQGERIARLETQVEHLQQTIDAMSKKLDELYTMLQRGKGAWWAGLGIFGLFSGAIGAAISKLLPFLGAVVK